MFFYSTKILKQNIQIFFSLKTSPSTPQTWTLFSNIYFSQPYWLLMTFQITNVFPQNNYWLYVYIDTPGLIVCANTPGENENQ